MTLLKTLNFKVKYDNVLTTATDDVVCLYDFDFDNFPEVQRDWRNVAFYSPVLETYLNKSMFNGSYDNTGRVYLQIPGSLIANEVNLLMEIYDENVQDPNQIPQNIFLKGDNPSAVDCEDWESNYGTECDGEIDSTDTLMDYDIPIPVFTYPISGQPFFLSYPTWIASNKKFKIDLELAHPFNTSVNNDFDLLINANSYIKSQITNAIYIDQNGNIGTYNGGTKTQLANIDNSFLRKGKDVDLLSIGYDETTNILTIFANNSIVYRRAIPNIEGNFIGMDPQGEQNGFGAIAITKTYNNIMGAKVSFEYQEQVVNPVAEAMVVLKGNTIAENHNLFECENVFIKLEDIPEEFEDFARSDGRNIKVFDKFGVEKAVYYFRYGYGDKPILIVKMEKGYITGDIILFLKFYSPSTKLTSNPNAIWNSFTFYNGNLSPNLEKKNANIVTRAIYGKALNLIGNNAIAGFKHSRDFSQTQMLVSLTKNTKSSKFGMDWTKNEIYNTGDTLSPDNTMYARERHYTTFAQSISRYIGTNAKAISGSSTTEANSILGGLTGRFTPLIGFRKTYNKSNKTYNFTFNNIVKYGTSKIELNINQNYTQEEIRLLNNSYNIIQNPQDSGSYMINMDIYEVAQVHCLMAMAGLNPTLEWLENTYEPSNVTLYNFKTTITLEDDQEYIDLANQDCDNEEYEENRYHYIRIKLPYDWITNNWLRDDLRNINIYIGANKLNYYAIKEYPNKLFALVAVPPNLFNKTMNFKVLIMGRNHIDFINETLFRNMIDTRQSRIWKKWGSEDPEVKYLNVLNVDDTVQYMIFRNSVYPESNDNINITFDNGSYLVINENYVRFYYDNNNYDEIYNGTSWNRESYEFQAELKVTAITGKNDTYFQMNCQCTSNQTKSQTNFASTTFRENGINYLRATNNNGLKINSASRLKNSKIETLLCADFKSYYKQQGFYMRIMGNNLLDDYSINDNTDNTALFTCNEFENNQNRNRLFKYVDGAKVVIMENANIFTIPSTMNGYPRLDVDPKIATIFTNSSKTVLEKFIYEEEEETLTSNIGVKLNTNGTNTIAGNASDMESIIAIFFQYNNYLKYYSSGAYTQGEMIVLDSTPIASRVCLEGVDKFNYDGGSLPEGLY